MFKKTLLLLAFGFSYQTILPVKIQTGSNNANHEFIADSGEFELSDTELNQLKSALIDGIIEDTGIIGRDTIPLPINKQTFALLKNMLSDTPEFNAERAESILHESTVTEFLPLLYALAFLNTTNEVLLQIVAQHYLAIQKNIGFDDFAQHVRYIAAFFQPNCVKDLMEQAAESYTCLQTFTGHTNRITSIAFSPDGQTVASGSFDKTARLWNVGTGQCLQTFTEHADTVYSVIFSPDGTKLATGSYDGTARIWDVVTGQCLQILNGHANWVLSVAFSPDGTKLATGSFDRTARLWNVNTGQCIQTLTGHTEWIFLVAFSPDGTKLATGSSDHDAKLWAILDTAQQVLLVWAMKNPGKFSIGVLPFLDEVYASLPEQLKEKIILPSNT